MIAALYVIGGVLELTGIGLVARDVRDAHRNAMTPLTPQRMQELRGSRMPNEFGLSDIAAKLAAGNIRRQAWGVGILALGVVVQMAGNVAALYV